jgi:hypothetical protein
MLWSANEEWGWGGGRPPTLILSRPLSTPQRVLGIFLYISSFYFISSSFHALSSVPLSLLTHTHIHPPHPFYLSLNLHSLCSHVSCLRPLQVGLWRRGTTPFTTFSNKWVQFPGAIYPAPAPTNNPGMPPSHSHPFPRQKKQPMHPKRWSKNLHTVKKRRYE